VPAGDGGGTGGLVRGWEEEEERGNAAPVESSLPRQAGWHGKAAAPVHVAWQARVHLPLARRASPA
jgi:hypothetical protein